MKIKREGNLLFLTAEDFVFHTGCREDGTVWHNGNPETINEWFDGIEMFPY